MLSQYSGTADRVENCQVGVLTTRQFLSDRAESARRVAFRGLDVGGRVAGGIATVAAAMGSRRSRRRWGRDGRGGDGIATGAAAMGSRRARRGWGRGGRGGGRRGKWPGGGPGGPKTTRGAWPACRGRA